MDEHLSLARTRFMSPKQSQGFAWIIVTMHAGSGKNLL